MPCVKSFSCLKPGKALCVGLSKIVKLYPNRAGVGPRARVQLGVKLWTIFLDVTVHALHYTKCDIECHYGDFSDKSSYE